MPKALYRYVISSLIAPFLGIIVFLLSLFLIFQLARLITLVSGQGLTFWEYLLFFSSISSNFLPLITPLAVFLASIYCFYKFSSESEFVAMRALGLGNWKLLYPALFFSFLVAVSLLMMNRELIPRGKKYFSLKIAQMRSNQFFSNLKSGQFFTEMKDVTLFPEAFNNDELSMKNVFVEFASRGDERKVLMAESGRFFWEVEQGVEMLKVEFYNGNINTFHETEVLDKVLFATYQYPVLKNSFHLDETHKATNMTQKELNQYLSTNLKTIKKLGGDERSISKANIEFWNRWNSAILCIIYCVLGLCLGGGHFRSRGKNLAFFALAIIVSYFALHFSLYSMAQKGSVSPFFSVMFPTSLLSLYTCWRLYRIQWLS